MNAPPTSPRHWFAPVPARRLTAVTTLTFGYAALWLLARSAYLFDVAGLPDRRFEPVGILDWMERPPGKGAIVLIWGVALAACVAAAFGRAVRLTAPVGALGMLMLVTFTSSFGQVFHTEHLVVLHMMVLAAGAVIEPPPLDGRTSGWPLNLMMAIVAVTYVAAGVAKLRWTGVRWVSGDALQTWVAVDNLRKALFDDLYSPIGGWLSGIGWIWMPVAILTLVVELGAPLALLTGRVRSIWLVAAWAFHVGVFVLMAISFPYQVSGVAYAAFLPVERLVARLDQLVRDRSPRRRVVGASTS